MMDSDWNQMVYPLSRTLDGAFKNYEINKNRKSTLYLINTLEKINKILSLNSNANLTKLIQIFGQHLEKCLCPKVSKTIQFKTLEIYNILFIKIIATDQDLTGLFPQFSQLDLNVKNALLNLYHKHLLPLGERFRPALDEFLISTLPDMTDIERTDNLLVRFCHSVHPKYFYRSLWKCVSEIPAVRLHGINFSISHFSIENHLAKENSSTLITAINSSLLAANEISVQRAALDFLVYRLTLYELNTTANKFNLITRANLISITTAAFNALQADDTDSSLIQRLHSWLFNSQTGEHASSFTLIKDAKDLERDHNFSKIIANEHSKHEYNSSKCGNVEQRIYFDLYSKDVLIEAVKNCLSSFESTVEINTCRLSITLDSKLKCTVWPYQLLILLTENEKFLTGDLMDYLHIDILRALYRDFNCLQTKKCTTPNCDHSKLDPTQMIGILLTERIGISNLWNTISILMLEICKGKSARLSTVRSTDSISQQQQHSCTQTLSYSMHDHESKTNKCHVKQVKTGSPDIFELCALSDFLMDLLSEYKILPSSQVSLPLFLKNLLHYMISYCDYLHVSECLCVLRVTSRIFHTIQKQFPSVSISDSSPKYCEIIEHIDCIRSCEKFSQECEKFDDSEKFETTDYHSGSPHSDGDRERINFEFDLEFQHNYQDRPVFSESSNDNAKRNYALMRSHSDMITSTSENSSESESGNGNDSTNQSNSHAHSEENLDERQKSFINNRSIMQSKNDDCNSTLNIENDQDNFHGKEREKNVKNDLVPENLNFYTSSWQPELSWSYQPTERISLYYDPYLYDGANNPTTSTANSQNVPA